MQEADEGKITVFKNIVFTLMSATCLFEEGAEPEPELEPGRSKLFEGNIGDLSEAKGFLFDDS